MQTKSRIESINAVAELERLSWPWVHLNESEIRVRCPAHDDDKPSAALNTQSNVWMCHASQCKAKGDIISFIALATKTNRQTVIVDLSKRYELDDIKVINPELIERFHKRIGEAGPLLQALYDRGVTDELIRKARIGFYDGRITIPVWDRNGHVVNVRRYLPGAPGPDKMRNTQGYGKPAIYQVDQLLKYESSWFCGGEMKALVASSFLNPLGVGAFSVTSGEGTWNTQWNALLADKRIYICMDVDQAGETASRRIAMQTRNAAKDVRIIRLALDREKHPKGDINDWVATEHAGVEDFKAAMQSSIEIKHNDMPADTIVGSRDVRLHNVRTHDHLGYELRFTAVVTTLAKEAYFVPAEISVSCTRDQPGCHMCPVASIKPDDEGMTRMTIPKYSAGILELVGCPKGGVSRAIRDALGIPACKVATFIESSCYTVYDAQLAPQLEMSASDGADLTIQAFIVDKEPRSAQNYAMKGRVYPHPRNRVISLVVTEFEETEDTLYNYAPTNEELDELKVFQVADESIQGIEAKLNEVYADLSHNVTRIYQRDQLHLVIDLTYHSVLEFMLDGMKVNGWVNGLVVGDTGQGKTETSTQLQKHYGLGEILDCKNMTVAGLLGGVLQMNNRWYISWGVIPRYDKRLVILEEVKGASTDVIAKLTDMRSRGIAELPKIERGRAYARTRLLFISNPRVNHSMSHYAFGVNSILPLIGAAEDVRRFDIACIVARGDVNRPRPGPRVPHRFTSSLSKRLLLWSWTRTADQVTFDEGASIAVSELSHKLQQKYTTDIPLVDAGTMHHKLARLSAALAARVYSTNDCDCLVVKRHHVEFTYQFLQRVYDAPSMGYDKVSAITTRTGDLDTTMARGALVMLTGPFRQSFANMCLFNSGLSLRDIEELSGFDQQQSRLFLARLGAANAVTRNVRTGVYMLNPQFISMLKELSDQKKLADDIVSEEPF